MIGMNPSRLKLTDAVLRSWAERLKEHTAQTQPLRWKYKGPSTRTWRHAAILIPLCTAHGKPSVLLTRRSRNLRRHAGEIAFPGGSLDASDRDEVAAALRETHEEILVPPNHVEILGQFHPIPDRTYSILIHPILAHIHTPHSLVPETMPYSKDEVDEIFAVSLEELLGSPTETELLRGTQHAISNWTVQGNKIWGLTAWVLNDTINTVIAPEGVHPEWKTTWASRYRMQNENAPKV